MKMIVGNRYNWIGQPERLIYLGENFSGNGMWHQFKKIDDPREVWCEVRTHELDYFEETKVEAESTSNMSEIELWNHSVSQKKLAKKMKSVLQ